jgi:DNA-binding CsgD family transcriptional regulator
MPGFRATDLRRTLAVTEPLLERDRADPFPSESLEALRSLVGAEAVGYCESPWTVGFGGYELATRPPPSWLPDALRVTALQDPTHPVFCGTATRPVAVSDFVTARELRRREVYDAIWKPLGVSDSLRLYLASPDGTARFFFFDRSKRGFSDRSRRLLGVLRPTLEHARGTWPAAAPVAQAELSAREREIMHWVGLGLTNDEVARRLWLSPHTVRTHLQHIYRKLGVRTRTEAAARLRSS